MPKAGIVTVVGKPNAGKSTLLNRIMREKLAIVSDKPQSTRDRVVGIHTTGDVQMIILDTPGLLSPRYELQRAMRGTALRALKDADIIVYLADATEGPPPSLSEAADLTTAPDAPVWTVLQQAPDAISATLKPGRPPAEVSRRAPHLGTHRRRRRGALRAARRAAPRKPLPLPGRRDQHRAGPLLRRGTRARNGTRAALR